MAKGNPNPDMSGLTPFEKGQSGNPGGKTKAQREAEVQAAEDAAILRAIMTRGLIAKAEAGEDMLEYLDANTLKLFKDSEDRAHGTPKAVTELGGPNGGDIPMGLTIGFRSKPD